MEDIANNLIIQYGALGLLVVGEGFAITKLWKYLQQRDQSHLKERQTWLDEFKKISDSFLEAVNKKL